MSVTTRSPFNYDAIPIGFYQSVVEAGNPVRRAWHLQKFERVIDSLPPGPGLSILDIGCFAGTFLSLLSPERFSRQVGIDILPSQIEYANKRFSSKHREFRYVENLGRLGEIEERFDCITVIEVIEHLSASEIRLLFERLALLLKPGGRLVVSTPNYASTWPLLELLVNHVSDVSYEEQHLTKFNYFTAERKLGRLAPFLKSDFRLLFKTTTHFCSPFLAWVSLSFARRVSRLFPHQSWPFPFGNLVLLQFEKQ